MADTYFPTSGVVGANPRSSSSTAQFGLGELAQGSGGQTLMYVLASGAIALYDVVTIDSTFTAKPLMKADADVGKQIGASSLMSIADGEYGWVVVAAPAVLVNVAASTQAGVALFTSSATGKLSSTSASQTEIKSVVLLATAGLTSTATLAYFSHPFVDVV